MESDLWLTVILVYKRQVCTSPLQFFVVAALFILVQVFHDDYLRIRVNGSAERGVERLKTK